MPIHLKNFYIREFMDLKKREKAEVDKANTQKAPTIPRRFNPKK